MTTLSLDWETRSTINLRVTGVYPYAMHATTDLWMGAWAFDDEEPVLWLPGETVPPRIVEHVLAGGDIRGWNVAFERVLWKHIATPRYGWPEAKLEQFVCAAAEAAAMSLPRSLDQCGQVTGVAQQKDSDGGNLMLRMCRPRKIHDDGRIEWWTVPERIARLGAYCIQDVRTEQAISKVIRRLSPAERRVYILTETMNDRGLTLDVDLVRAAKGIVDEGIARASHEVEALTNGAVTEITQTGKLREYLKVDSVAKDAVRDLLEGNLDPNDRAVLELRQEAGRSSVAKLDSLLNCVCTDGRIRGMLLYHGAATGRWTGRLAQVHNFPRGEVDRIEEYIPAVLAGDYDGINLFAHPIVVVLSMLRSMITASPGHELLVADYAGIEARVLAVLAGQDDDVELFRRGEDVYEHMATQLYGVPLAEVTRAQRQAGKAAVLGCGYQMGAKKFVSAAKAAHGLELSPEEAKRVVSIYRSTHARVVKLWDETNAAAIEAVTNAGSVVTFGALRNLKFTKQGAYLYLVLPSKRALVYAAPRVVDRETPWGSVQPAVEISAINPVTRKWTRQALYGGLLVENIVQAVSRDLLAEAKLRLEANGYPVVLSLHDEGVVERRIGEGSLEEFVSLMEECPPWAAGWPIKAEGWQGKRYHK